MSEMLLINDRFSIDPLRNLIKDLQINEEIYLEPRIMQVLRVLLTHQNTVVARETLIAEVWKNYPGGDDGLHQAISVLRKALRDTNKELIKTIPKKGYCLQVEVAKVAASGYQQPVHGEQNGKKSNRPKFIAIVLAIAGVIITFFIYKATEQKPSTVKSPKSTFTPFPHLETPKEDYLNTVTTIDSLGRNYKLVVIGDKRPIFYVNGQIAKEHEMEKYTSLIEGMSRTLWKRRAKAESK